MTEKNKFLLNCLKKSQGIVLLMLMIRCLFLDYSYNPMDHYSHCCVFEFDADAFLFDDVVLVTDDEPLQALKLHNIYVELLVPLLIEKNFLTKITYK